MYFLVLFLVLEVLLFIFLKLSNFLPYLVSAVLFILAFLLMKIAGRTNSVKKEIYYSVTAGLLAYYAVFAIPIFIGAIRLNQSAFIFLILFALFVSSEKGSFRNVLVNITVSLMLLFGMFTYGTHGIPYFLVIFIISMIICLLLSWMFVNSKPSKFESRAILQVVFSFSVITMLWSLFNVIK